MVAFLVLALLLPTNGSGAESAAVCRYCQDVHCALGTVLTDNPGRKYGRDRFVGVLHMSLDVTMEFARRTVGGTVTLSFVPIAKPLARPELDAVGLKIAGIAVKGATLAELNVMDGKLSLSFKYPIAVSADWRRFHFTLENRT